MNKKKYLIILFLLFFVKYNLLSQNNLILRLPFNNNLNDISGNNNHGIKHGNVTYGNDRADNPCSAIYLKEQGYITIPHSKNFNTISNEFSVTVWFKIEKGNDNFLWLTLVCKGDLPNETDNSPHFRVQLLQTDIQSTVSINTEFTEYDNNYKNHMFIPNKWMFFALTYDGSKVTTYLDGNKTWEFPYYGTLYKNNSPLYIGKDIPGTTEFFKGYLDDLRIYNNALSENEIIKIYKEKIAVNKQKAKIECPGNIEINTEPEKCGATVNYLPSFSTNCGTIQAEQLKGLPSENFFQTGIHNVVYKITYNNNIKICRFNIHVIDKEKPKIICPDNYEVLMKNDSINIKFKTPKVSDNCGIKEISEKEYGGNLLIRSPGIYVPNFVVYDTNGNKNSCSYKVNVIKKIKPDSVPEQNETNENSAENNIIEKDSVTYKDDINFNKRYVIVEIYDDRIEDNDTISVFFNYKEIIHYKKIRKRGNKTIILNLDLKEKEKNSMIIKAWNVGEIPPNTVKMDFYETDYQNDKKIPRTQPVYSKVLHSKPGFSSAIWLNFK